jgi:hypothetical protein
MSHLIRLGNSALHWINGAQRPAQFGHTNPIELQQLKKDLNSHLELFYRLPEDHR